MRRNRRGLMATAALIAMLTLVAGACSKKAPAETGAKQLTGAGATFPAPLYQKWAGQYNRETGVQINYQSIGSGGGIQQITAKTVDFGASDAPMKDEELAKVTGTMLHIPMVFGSVVVTYNVTGVKTGLKMTSDVIAGVFSAKIKKWNDAQIVALNPGVTLPASAITVVHRSDGSGTTNTFTSYLAKVNAAWSASIGKGKEVPWPKGELGGKGNDGVANTVKQTPGSIGYVELQYASANGLPVASVKNAAGAFIEPSLASTSAAAVGATIPDDLRFSINNAPGPQAYPIASATWLLVYQKQTDAAKGKALVAFLKWALSKGQTYASQLLYAPLPDSLIAKALVKVNSITY